MKHLEHIEHRPIYRHMMAMNRIQPYRYQRALWLALVSTVVLSFVMIIGAVSPVNHRIEPGFHIEFVIVANLIFFTAIYVFTFRMMRGRLRNAPLLLVSLGGSIALTVLLGMLGFVVETAIYGQAFNNLTISIIIDTSAAIIAYLVSLLLYNITEHQRTLLENEHLQAENLRIHHEALEQQMSPHYLFNTLNTLDGLIGIDDERAHNYLRQLAATLRYTLQPNRDVSLADELQFTRAYIGIMQTRYGDALHIDINIPVELLDTRVPAISLQLLVENAIKHNVITARHPLAISITAQDGTLTVSNPLQPKADNEASNGIGLDNLSMRYRLLCNRDITITHNENTFSVEMPLIHGVESEKTKSEQIKESTYQR